MKNIEELIIAHRGESLDAPENTLESINLAWERGVRAVEIDIRMTFDNHIVVIHDKNTYRTTGKNLSISKSLLVDIQSQCINIGKDQEKTYPQIPTLEAVLKTVPQDGRLIIEIKSNLSILNELSMMLTKSGLANHQIQIIAFSIKTLRNAKEMMPQYKMFWLLNLDHSWPPYLVRVNKKRILRKLQRYNLDGLNVWAGKKLDAGFIQFFTNNGFEVLTWTVNDLQHARKLMGQGIGGITTDKAAWMIKEM